MSRPGFTQRGRRVHASGLPPDAGPQPHMNPSVSELHGADHVERYKATDGEEGHDWKGTKTLLLTTKGRRSGEPRTTPLIYAPLDGGGYAVVASKGGSDVPPAWYLNLSEEPVVEVQV